MKKNELKKLGLNLENKMNNIKKRAKKDAQGYAILTSKQCKKYFDLNFQLQKIQVLYLAKQMGI